MLIPSSSQIVHPVDQPAVDNYSTDDGTSLQHPTSRVDTDNTHIRAFSGRQRDWANHGPHILMGGPRPYRV